MNKSIADNGGSKSHQAASIAADNIVSEINNLSAELNEKMNQATKLGYQIGAKIELYQSPSRSLHMPFIQIELYDSRC